MSKVAFISDIHGNYPALCAVLQYCKKRGIQSIYCLGDLVGYYSQVNEVIGTLIGHKIPCIMGNHDYAMAYNGGSIDRSRTCTDTLKQQLSYITPSNLTYIRNLPDQMLLNIDGKKVWCAHGGVNNHIDEYICELNDAYFDCLSPDVAFVVTAHSHKASTKELGKLKYANCGSIGQPRDHDSRASFVILENQEFEIVRVQYDIDEVVKEMRRKGFPDYISDVLFRGCRIGE